MARAMIQTYKRMNVETGEQQEIRITAENAFRFDFSSYHGMEYLDALCMVNEWNRIASLNSASKWRYWI